MSITKLTTALAAAVAASAVLVGPLVVAPAAQAADDGFYIMTDDGCGQANFEDYGPGLPGGGNNDDYILVTDYCSDHHGVKVWAWLTRGGTKHYLGAAYDPYGNFLDGHPRELWDPFGTYGTVQTNDFVGLKVCLVDGDADPTPTHCYSETHQSHSGFVPAG